jgi:hypothetical protein
MGDTPHLAIQFLWEDSNLEQLRISADNGRYSGTAKVYFSQGELRDFLHSIRGFPKHVAQTELFAGGSEETFPFARLEFHCTDGAGHSAVDVALGETVVTGRSPTRNRVSLRLEFEPNAVDEFCKELEEVVGRRTGRATLAGKAA